MLVQNCHNRNHPQAEAVSSSIVQNSATVLPPQDNNSDSSNSNFQSSLSITQAGDISSASPAIVRTSAAVPTSDEVLGDWLVQNENFGTTRQTIYLATRQTDTVNNNNNNNNNNVNQSEGEQTNVNLSQAFESQACLDNNVQAETESFTPNQNTICAPKDKPRGVDAGVGAEQKHQNCTPNQNKADKQPSPSPKNGIVSPTGGENPILSEFDYVASLNRFDKDKVKQTPLEPPTLNYFSKGQQSQLTLRQAQQPQAQKKPVNRIPPPPPPRSQISQRALPLPSPGIPPVLYPAPPKTSSLVHSQSISEKMSDAYLSGVMPDKLKNQKNSGISSLVSSASMMMRQGPTSAPNTPESMRKQHLHLFRGRMDPMTVSLHDKKEKMEFNQMMMRMNERDTRPLSYHGRSYSLIAGEPRYDHGTEGSGGGGAGTGMVVNKRHLTSSNSSRSRKESTMMNRRSMPNPHYENRYRDKFDLDTNLPRIDLDSIENHLRQAREEERKRRSDREEIRRRLALESDDLIDKPAGRKPSLQSRLQSSMNLQICFMNETASDSESPNSDTESKNQQPNSLPCVKVPVADFELSGSKVQLGSSSSEDFQTKQSRLQIEARQALSQAKEMARLQMAQEKDQRLSPITDMLRNSLEKVGIQLQPERRRLTRQLLTEMNVTQLQVIVNDLHSHIEMLNEGLVSLLLERDDLHMEQDSMLVDIEDLTRYLAAKDNSPHQSLPVISARSYLGKN